jgi:hypothetical protein
VMLDGGASIQYRSETTNGFDGGAKVCEFTRCDEAIGWRR